MKYTYILILVLCPFFLFAQISDDLEFGSEETLEVITWNIEHFPKLGQTTVSLVSQVIEELNADVIAIQEIDNGSTFTSMANNLDGFESEYIQGYYSSLGFIYKENTVQVNDVYEIYNSSSYWSAFPRAPLVLDITYKGENFIIINNHFKCCGDGYLQLNDDDDEETRRYYASYYLKRYIDDRFFDKNVIVVGDLNDEITDTYNNNVFREIMSDSEHYRFADMDIAEAGSSNWSFPTWPSHLDHILINNNLFDEYDDYRREVRCIKIDDYISGGWNSYDSKITDHRPVGIKLYVEGSVGQQEFSDSECNIYPNPSTGSFRLSAPENSEIYTIKIFDSYGRTVKTLNPDNTLYTISDINSGVYFVKIIFTDKEASVLKFVKK
jgi:endonuclease/exonuclease/phosphatase family metal-dependent hydrolase